MAQIKSFFLKIFKRALSYFRAFKELDNILFWRIHKYKCCYCGFNYHIYLKKKNRYHSSKSFSGYSVRCLKCHSNLINTSLKLPLTIRVKSVDKQKIFIFEKFLNEQELIYDFSIIKYNKDFLIYDVIFNGTPTIFLKKMQENDLDIDTQNKIWTLE